jgi:hypothetical protein
LGAVRRALPIIALWAALASGLSALTTRVSDWWVMTDELLYERLAIAIARTHSPLPRVHGVGVDSFSQLYPLLVSPAFLNGLVPDDLRQAHFINAWLMASACIPAFLLARRVTTRAWAAYLVAVLSVCTPWILYASFLLTEVAAYPAFLWAMLALQRALAQPSGRNDVLALAGLALAFVARTQFAVLAIVLPLAIVARCRSVRELRQTVGTHRVLAGAYAAIAVGALTLAVVGRLGSVFGVYEGTVSSGLVPDGVFSSLPEHVATFSLGFGILPFVVALAWLLANLVRLPASMETSAFATLATITVAAVMLEVTVYDLRFGVGYVHDRYLLYLAPLVLLGFVCALLDSSRPRWSLLAPAALVSLGFALGGQPSFAWPDQFGRLNTESPVSALYALVEGWVHGVRATHVLLAVATPALAALFALGAAVLRHGWLTALLAGSLLVGLPLETGYVFDKFFGVDGWSSRPVTNPGSSALVWVDEKVGTRAEVTMVPYPVSTAFFVNQQVWRDYEFWNKSIVRNVQYSGRYVFRYTSDTFPKVFPRFDPRTGLSDVSLTRYVLHANQESRFRISGETLAQADARLIDAGETWRTDWLSFGLYDDGWTRPGVPAQVRVFAAPGQGRSLVRFLSFQIRTPGGVRARRVDIVSNLEEWHGEAAGTETLRRTVRVCVPARGFARVRVRTPDVSAIPGDLRDLPSSLAPRRGGVFLAEIALSDDIGGPCSS